ncbi:MAG: LEA type 2 family protein [Chitinophagaceae bacterium]|nr:LEA type 2 family protein [Chitinophagaceae bacterium]
MNIFNKLKTTLFLLSFFTIIASSCNQIKDLEYKGVGETKMESLQLNNAKMRIVLQYFNPNKFGLDVKETQLEVYGNDTYLGIAEQPEAMSVPANSAFDFPIIINFNPLKAVGSAFKNLTAKTIKLHVKGTAKVGKGGVFVKVPVDVVEDVEVRK